MEEETCDVDDDVADDVEADVADWTIVTAPACDPGDAQTHARPREAAQARSGSARSARSAPE